MSELKFRPPKEGKVGNLLVAEGFDGIQAGGAAGGVQACDQADHYGEGDGA